MASFIFRTWSDAKTARLREMWWDGKSAKQCAELLGFKTHQVVRTKVALEGFVRDPALLDRKSALAEQPREDGTLVTLANCTARECRWICRYQDHEAILCGRRIERGSMCKAHRMRAYTGEKSVE